MVLDAAAASKVSWGSYHAITDMIPSLAVRYPYMCYQFLAQLELFALGDLEVPVAVIKGLDQSVIRTAPIFTNVRNLWQSHLKLHEVGDGWWGGVPVRLLVVFCCAWPMIGRRASCWVEGGGTETGVAVLVRCCVRMLCACASNVLFLAIYVRGLCCHDHGSMLQQRGADGCPTAVRCVARR